MFEIEETPDSLFFYNFRGRVDSKDNLKNFFVDDTFLYAFGGHQGHHTYGVNMPTPWRGDVNTIYKANLIDMKYDNYTSIYKISTPYVHSNKFLGNDKRLIWLMGKCDSISICRNQLAEYYHGPVPNSPSSYYVDLYQGYRNTIDGIYFIEFSQNFKQNNIKSNKRWDTIKSNLDKHYASHPKTDSMVSRYINMLGFRNNNLLFMLRDKWIDTNTIKKERNDSVDYNFDWYENTIYVLNFDGYNPYRDEFLTWDTLDLHRGFSLLEQYDSEKWIIENRVIGKPNHYADVPIDYYGIYKWSDNELAIAIQPRGELIINPAFENANRIFLIYNIDTKDWSKFVFPSEVVPFYSQKNVVDFNGDKYFHITSCNNDDTVYFMNTLLKYSPNSSIEYAEEGIFKEIGIRNIYPNPAKHSVTAEIMCYVRDRSKLDIGLYNMLGQKILDLNYNYEYNDATKTIYMTIKLPPEYQEGVYFLNVRNGTEFRTKGIVFGK